MTFTASPRSGRSTGTGAGACRGGAADPITSITVDTEITKLRDLEQVTSRVGTHQIRDAFYIATHQAIRKDGEVRIITADTTLADPAEFMVLHDGRIHFEGTAAELLASRDPYLHHFLHRTLPPW